MRPTVPRFPLLEEPGEWDELTLIASTVALEAEGEPESGQLGVAYVVMNRVRLWDRTVHQVILGPDERAYGDGKAFEVFSCWNDTYKAHATARLSGLIAFPPAWKAAATAFWQLAADPTGGATHYLNVELTKKLRGGTLPAWFHSDNQVTAVIGRHHFLVA